MSFPPFLYVGDINLEDSRTPDWNVDSPMGSLEKVIPGPVAMTADDLWWNYKVGLPNLLRERLPLCLVLFQFTARQVCDCECRLAQQWWPTESLIYRVTAIWLLEDPLSSHWHMLLQDIRAASPLCWIVAPSAHDWTVTLRTQPANLFGMKPSALCRKTCMHIFIFLLQLKHGKSYSNQRLCHVLRHIWDSCYSKQTMQHRTGSASSFACGCAALL